MERVTYRASDAVREFHLKNNQLINETPREDVPYTCVLLRIRLIQEELAELIIGVHKHDILLIADGLADLKYVLLGTAVSYGIALIDIFPDEIDLESMGKLDTDFLTQVMHVSKLSFLAGKVERDLYMGSDKCETHGWQHREIAAESLIELDMAISDMAAEYGIPLEEIFFEVHRSNMSKRLSGTAGEGGKYGEGDNPKGEGYTPPNIEGILALRRVKDQVVH